VATSTASAKPHLGMANGNPASPIFPSNPARVI
jgi:hypothetical protein